MRLVPVFSLFLLTAAVPAFGQGFGSFAGGGPSGFQSGGMMSGPGSFVDSRSDDAVGFARTIGVGQQGGSVSHSYSFRLPDGRHVALSHQLGINGGGAFYGSAAAEGRAAHAGGEFFGNASGQMRARSLPTPWHPAWSRTVSRSYPR